MPSLVPSTDQRPPTNRYRHQMIAPPRASVCCVAAMEWLDAPQRDVRGVYQDRRCRRCGFTVRVLLRELSDAAWIARLCVS
jgi:ribosomal protein S14